MSGKDGINKYLRQIYIHQRRTGNITIVPEESRIRQLLSEGADPNNFGKWGTYPYEGINLSNYDAGATPIGILINDHLLFMDPQDAYDIFKLLIDSGAQLKPGPWMKGNYMTTTYLGTLLHQYPYIEREYKERYGKNSSYALKVIRDIMQLFIDNGADPLTTLKMDIGEEYPDTRKYHLRDDPDVASLLIRNGLFSDMSTEYARNLKAFISKPMLAELKRRDDEQALIIAKKKQLEQPDPNFNLFDHGTHILGQPGGKLERALRATNSNFRDSLCHDLSSNMYKDELYDLAISLELPVNKKSTKQELCELIADYATTHSIDVRMAIKP